MNQTKRARLHRFRQSVALAIGGQTLYLPADLAEKLGEELRRYSAEIAAGVPFTDSKVGTTVVGQAEPGEPGEDSEP